MDQMALEDAEGYEAEHTAGVTAPAFPVVIQPTTDGAIVSGPEWLGSDTYHDGDETYVVLCFPRA